ncbi:hypothetical protein WJX81_000334 [Elliptochloris bilobata]|uniref:6-phosphofructo-2-kinase domain-containing protein n=1 Tax=Elliptochloris bilobata TaxID=381761 RepID=A0AAW1RJ30_9CHLO
MWEYWRSRLSKGRTRHRKRTGSDGNSPTAQRLPGESQQLPDAGPPQNSTHVYFKDVIIAASDDSEEESEPSESVETGEGMRRRVSRKRKLRIDRQKLIIILVGLPGRGKTFLCNKLMCYLNWLGHPTRHFNVGQYRRKQKGESDVQDAAFFDHNNPAGREARHRALIAALEDMEGWLATADAQVAIFDATNSTEERRSLLRNRFHGRWQYLFIESICNDAAVLEQNYRFKMMYSPDYTEQDSEAALEDFRDRIRRYEEVYETITDRNLHYIKLIDMVTGRGYMDVNRISGYIPGKMVFFLMQVCKSGVTRLRKIWLTRHGESEYNRMALLGGDSNITDSGRAYAAVLPDIVIDRVPLTSEGATMPVSVWTSTLKRTIQTAEHLPFPKLRWKALDEIHAGIFDGMSYEQIEEQQPEEFRARKSDKLRYRYPSGESYMDVIQRLEPVVIEIERERECVCVVAHQAILRAIYGYFTKTPLKDIPRLEIPLHTLIELVPKPDGRMAEERIPFDPATGRIGEPIVGQGSVSEMTPFQTLSALGSMSLSSMNNLSKMTSARWRHSFSASTPNIADMAQDDALQQGAAEAPSVASDWPLGQKGLASAPLRALPFSTAPLSPFGPGQSAPPMQQLAVPAGGTQRSSGGGNAAVANGREGAGGGASAAVPIPGSSGDGAQTRAVPKVSPGRVDRVAGVDRWVDQSAAAAAAPVALAAAATNGGGGGASPGLAGNGIPPLYPGAPSSGVRAASSASGSRRASIDGHATGSSPP